MILTFYFLQALVTSFISFMVGFFVFLKNKRNLVNRTFALWTLAVAIWAFGISMHALTKDAYFGLIWSRILHGAAIWIPTFFLHFIFALLNLEKKKWILWLSYLSSFIFFIFNFTNLFIREVRQVLNFEHFPAAGPVYPLFILMFGICVFYSLYNMRKAIKDSLGNRRNQIKYVFWGSVIGFAGGSTTFFPIFNIKVFPAGNFFIFLYILLVAYAIVKYHLMDIRIALTRVSIFLFVYLFVLGLPFWFGYRTKLWFPSTLMTAALASLGPFIYSYLRRRAENTLLSEQKRYQKVLLQAASGMVREHNLKKLIKLIAYILKRSVRISFTAAFLFNREKEIYQLTAVRGKNAFSTAKVIFLPEHPFIDYLKKKQFSRIV